MSGRSLRGKRTPLPERRPPKKMRPDPVRCTRDSGRKVVQALDPMVAHRGGRAYRPRSCSMGGRDARSCYADIGRNAGAGGGRAACPSSRNPRSVASLRRHSRFVQARSGVFLRFLCVGLFLMLSLPSSCVEVLGRTPSPACSRDEPSPRIRFPAIRFTEAGLGLRHKNVPSWFALRCHGSLRFC